MSQDRPPKLFVSHPSTRADTAAHIERALNARGVECWIAPRDIGPGEQWDIAIRKAIGETDAMLLLFCADSDRSIQVKRELILADQAQKAIIPMRLERVEPQDLSYHLASSQWIDWIEQRDVAIERVAAKARELHGSAGDPAAPIPAPPLAYDGERPGRTGSIPYLIGGGVLVLLLGFALWWFALRQPDAQVAAATNGATPASPSKSAASTSAAPSNNAASAAPSNNAASAAPAATAGPITAQWFAGVWGQEMPCVNHYRFDRSGALTDPNGVGGRWTLEDEVLTKELGGSTHRLPLTRVGEDEVSTPEGPLYRCFAGAT